MLRVETLFIPNPQGNYNHEDIKVNPRHPRAQFYQLLMDSYAQDQSEEHFKQTIIDPYLNAPSNGEQDLSDEEMGHSLRLFTPPPDKDSIMEHWDGDINAPNSYAYNDYSYQRYISNFNINTVTDHQQLLVALGSLSSSVEQYMPHSANCVKCKNNKRQDLIELLADSGTSLNFTHEQSDLSEFQQAHDDDFNVQTATKSPPLAVKGVGCMFFTTSVTSGIRRKKLIHLYPVFYIPGINHIFLSVGTLLNQGLMLRGSSSHVEFRSHKSNQLEIVCEPHELGQTIHVYWLSVKLASADSLLAKLLICSIDYNIMHRQFSHPSKDVLQHASGTTLGFPSITFPHEEHICPRCAEGKMTRSVFPASDQRSAKPFDKIHMDLKAMPVCSYHGYNYFLIIFDDATSHSWTVNLIQKSDADPAIWQFIAMVKTQFGLLIKEVQINAGGEFKSQEFTIFL